MPSEASQTTMVRIDPRIEIATNAFVLRQTVGTQVLFEDMKAALIAADRNLLSRLPMMRDRRGTVWVELAALEGMLAHE